MKNMRASEILTEEYLKSVHEVLEVKEIAKATNCAPSTVRKYIHLYGLSVKNSRKGKLLGSKHPNWKGGTLKTDSGYVRVQVAPYTYQRQHRLIIEGYIGRDLQADERVHHLNGVRDDDNRIENLLVMPKRIHDKYHTTLRNMSKDYQDHTIADILEVLAIYTEELEMYAELTRILQV